MNIKGIRRDGPRIGMSKEDILGDMLCWKLGNQEQALGRL
jgi:hypothetical protein